jgi:hypothetical protein
MLELPAWYWLPLIPSFLLIEGWSFAPKRKGGRFGQYAFRIVRIVISCNGAARIALRREAATPGARLEL